MPIKKTNLEGLKSLLKISSLENYLKNYTWIFLYVIQKYAAEDKIKHAFRIQALQKIWSKTNHFYFSLCLIIYICNILSLTYPLPALKSWFLIFAMSFTWCYGDSISFHVWLSHCGSHCYYSWQYFSDSCCLWLFGVCSATSSEECGLVIQRSNFHTISVTFALFQKDKGLSNLTYFSATWFKSLSKMNCHKMSRDRSSLFTSVWHGYLLFGTYGRSERIVLSALNFQICIMVQSHCKLFNCW